MDYMLLVMYQKNKFDLDTSFQGRCDVLYSVWVELSPSLKKGVLCKECKGRFFLTYYMHLALKYILCFSLLVHVNVMRTDHVFSHACSCSHAKGKRLRSQTKEVVVNVYDYFKEFNRRQWTLGPIKQISDVTGVSCASIKRLWKEKVDTGGDAFSTLTKRYRHSIRLLVNDFYCEAIRWKIYHLYQDKELVTHAKLLVALKKRTITSFTVRGQPFISC